jgi:hypothetical protein
MPPDFQSIATRFSTTERTVRRWDELGVDVTDPLSVAIHLASIQHPAPAAFDTAEKLLTQELNQ